MTVQILWKNLKELVAFDNAIVDVEKEIKQAELAIEQLNAQLPLLDQVQQEKEVTCKEMQKNVDSYELSAAELGAREKSKKHALDSVKNQKEYEAITSELDEIASEGVPLEDSLIQAWASLESAQRDVEKYKKTAAEQKEQLLQKIEEHKQMLATLQERIAKVRENRSAAAGGISAEWLTKYERMRKSVPDPIVAVINGSCGSCFYKVLRQDLARIEKNAILPCKSCYRLLYKEEVEQTV